MMGGFLSVFFGFLEFLKLCKAPKGDAEVPEGDAAGDPDEPPGRGRRIQSAASAPEAAADIVQLPD